MTDDKVPKVVRAFAPRADQLEAKVKALAQDSFNVAIKKTYHAEDRQDERDITDLMIHTVLKSGHITGEIECGERPGEWVFKMTKRMKGKREVGVVSVLMKGPKLLVITAEWEDL